MRGARLLVQMNVAVQNAKKYAGFNAVEIFPEHPDEMGFCRKGGLPPTAGSGKQYGIYPRVKNSNYTRRTRRT